MSQMECMKDRVRKELSKPPMGSNTKCTYYPCHHSGQDCTFCYCPFYPCNDKEVGGREITSRKGAPVWSCMQCHFMHSKEPTEYVHNRLSIEGIDDEERLRALFDEVKELFFYPKQEHWMELAEHQKE
jgi:threonine-phosphate decarboxylase